MKALTGKVAIVTGAGRGIGQAIARAYAGAGASVCCAARTVEQYGGLDILVINAGVDLDPHTVEHSQTELWRTTLETNLTGAYLCAKAAIPHLRQRGAGKIITVGSGLGHRGAPATAAYACSKAGLWMLTRVLAQELAQDNISVNELIPGPVETATSS